MSTTRTNKWSYGHQKCIQIYCTISYPEFRISILSFSSTLMLCTRRMRSTRRTSARATPSVTSLTSRSGTPAKKCKSSRPTSRRSWRRWPPPRPRWTRPRRSSRTRTTTWTRLRGNFNFNSIEFSITIFNFQALRPDGGGGHRVRGEAGHHRHEARPHVQGGRQHHQGWCYCLTIICINDTQIKTIFDRVPVTGSQRTWTMRWRLRLWRQTWRRPRGLVSSIGEMVNLWISELVNLWNEEL